MFTELSKLFQSPLRTKLITFFALQPNERTTAAVAARVIGATKDAVQPELSVLVRLGVLTKRSTKEGASFGWNSSYAHAGALQDFIASCLPTDAAIVSLLRPLGAHLVVVSGILAGEPRTAIDLLIVTRRPKDARITKLIRKLERQAAIPVRFMVMEVGEYLDRMQAFDRTLRDMMDFRHRVVIGRTNGAGK
jgi:hypothetical protein